MIASYTSNSGTLIIIIINTILISIGNRTTVVLRNARHSRTFVFVIGYAIAIGILKCFNNRNRGQRLWLFFFLANDAVNADAMKKMIIGCFVISRNAVLRSEIDSRLIKQIYSQANAQRHKSTIITFIRMYAHANCCIRYYPIVFGYQFKVGGGVSFQ